MKMLTAKCSQCPRRFRAKTKSELLERLRDHIWAQHRSWMLSRIKAGQKRAELDNPSIQDMVQAIQKGSSRAAIAVAQNMTEGRYQQVKRVMDAVSPVLPLKAQLAWEGVEAAHDLYHKFKKARR